MEYIIDYYSIILREYRLIKRKMFAKRLKAKYANCQSMFDFRFFR